MTRSQIFQRAILGTIAAIASFPQASAETNPPPCVATKPGPKPSADTPQFYDEPQFTVAGVKDPSETGGHGSDTVRRTTESLTKETVGLSATKPPEAVPAKDEATARAKLAQEPDNASAHRALADIEEQKGNSLAAVQEYQRAADLEPSETNLFDWASELLLHRAYEPASEVFAKGRRLFPASVRMAMGLGVAAYALGSYDLAAQKFCEASDVDPSDERPYLFLGKLQAVGSGLVPGVVERLERFERLHGENAWASYYHAMAVWNRRVGHPEAVAQVEHLLKSAIGKDPKLAVADLQLGIVYSEQKEWLKAAEWLQSAVRVDPATEEGHFRLATAYRMLGALDKSKAELEVYERIAKKNNNIAEQNRRDVTQFVYSSRPAPSGDGKR